MAVYLCLGMNLGWGIFLLSWTRVRWVVLGISCMLGGVLFMFSAVKVFVDYCGVYVFQVCFHLFMVLGFVFDLCGVVVC